MNSKLLAIIIVVMMAVRIVLEVFLLSYENCDYTSPLNSLYKCMDNTSAKWPQCCWKVWEELINFIFINMISAFDP